MGAVLGEIVAGVLGETVAGEAVAGATEAVAGSTVESAAGAAAGSTTVASATEGIFSGAMQTAGALGNMELMAGGIKSAGEKILGNGGAAEAGAGAAAGAAENVNPLAKLSFSWDNAGRAFKDAGSRALNSTSEGRALSTLYNGGDVNMDSLRSAAVQYGTDKLGEALGKHGKGGRMVAAAIGLGANKSKEEEDSAKDDKAAVEAAANPAKHGVYGQFGAAPPVQVPRQAAPQFNMIDYFNSLMGENNGRYQA